MPSIIQDQQTRAFQEAAIIDARIEGLMEKYPIEEFPWFWMKFARTVISGLSVIEEISKMQVHKDLQ